MKAQVNFDSLGGGGDLVGDLLYENLEKTATSGFTLNIDSSKYSKLYIVCYASNIGASDTPYLSTTIEHDGKNGNPTFLGYSGGYVIYNRLFNWTNNTLTVGNGYLFTIPGSQTSYSDTYVIPYQIYGIK